MNKAQKIGKNIIMSLIIPVVIYLFFFIICKARGIEGFGVGTDLQTMIYVAIYNGLIAIAMSINLTSGRFDFSVGATMVLSIIISGNIAKDYGLGPIPFLIITMICGAVIGLVSGLVYVTLSLPPMVVSLGLAMIYEAIGFIIKSANGIKLIGYNNLLIFAAPPWSIVLIVVVLIVMVIIWDFTKFGYERNALASGQKIATDVGVNEKKNAVICYVIAGVLLSLAMLVYISKYGAVTPETGLSSSSYFMTAFLPMFIGGVIAQYSSRPVAIFIGAFAQGIISSGLVKLGASNSTLTVINGIIVMAFLIYTSNSYKLVEAKLFKEKLEKAKEARNA